MAESLTQSPGVECRLDRVNDSPQVSPANHLRPDTPVIVHEAGTSAGEIASAREEQACTG